MPGFAAWLAYLAAAVGIVTFLGAAAMYLNGSKDKGTITTLETNNRALTERVTVVESSELRLKADVDRLTQRVQHLEAENAELKSQRPSAEAIAQLARRVAELSERQVASLAAQLSQHDTDIKRLLRSAVSETGDP